MTAVEIIWLSVLMWRMVDSMFWACWLAARKSACSKQQHAQQDTSINARIATAPEAMRLKHSCVGGAEADG
jgi:hypothetical protein